MKSAATIEWTAWLGRHFRDPEAVAFLGSLGEEPHLDADHDGAHCTFLESGFSLTFDSDGATSCIFINIEPDPPFAACPFPLPFDLNRGMTFEDVSKLLGKTIGSMATEVVAVNGKPNPETDMASIALWAFPSYTLMAFFSRQKARLTAISLMDVTVIAQPEDGYQLDR